jgi:hypothetical protein
MGIRLFLAAVCVLALAGARSFAADASDAAPPESQLPAGWSMEDMQKMMAAGTPGEMHQKLADDIGTWKCKTTMWMTPDAEPMESEGVAIVTPLMDGRYVQAEMKGEMPGMGPYNGRGTYGYDNTKKQFVSTWIDNCSTAMMTGVGELSDDGKTITWTYEGYCPIQEGEITMRDVETKTGENTKVLETFGPDRKTGKEYKVMRIEMTRE